MTACTLDGVNIFKLCAFVILVNFANFEDFGEFCVFDNLVNFRSFAISDFCHSKICMHFDILVNYVNSCYIAILYMIFLTEYSNSKRHHLVLMCGQIKTKIDLFYL